MDCFFDKDGFGNVARYGFSHTAACRQEELQNFLAFRGPRDYSSIKHALSNFHLNRLTFIGPSNRISDGPITRLLVRPDSHSQKIEKKVDALAEDLSSLKIFNE